MFSNYVFSKTGQEEEKSNNNTKNLTLERWCWQTMSQKKRKREKQLAIVDDCVDVAIQRSEEYIKINKETNCNNQTKTKTTNGYFRWQTKDIVHEMT